MKPPARKVEIDDLVEEAKTNLVVISGGEPFIHPELPVLVKRLKEEGYKVSIETSGAFYQEIVGGVWIIPSPKEHLNPKYPVNPEMWTRASEIKIVISDGTEVDFYWERLKRSRVVGVPVYLQPEWTVRDKATPIAIELANRHNLKLSVQVHKFIGAR